MYAIIAPTYAGQLPELADTKSDAIEKASLMSKRMPGHTVFICMAVYTIKTEIRYETVQGGIKR